MVRRALSLLGRVIRGIGRELAATIRFGAIPAASAPDGYPAQTAPIAAVAGITAIEAGSGERDEIDGAPDDAWRVPSDPEDLAVRQTERERLVEAIRAAFAGVRLGDGVSLRQAESMDNVFMGRRNTAWPGPDIQDDWSRVTEAELLRDNTAHLDAEGLRYYLPALMLWLLDYDEEPPWVGDGVMTALGTVTALAPYKEGRDWHYSWFDSWSPEQRSSIAAYVEALSRLIELDEEDASRLEEAMRDYWGRFLPGK